MIDAPSGRKQCMNSRGRLGGAPGIIPVLSLSFFPAHLEPYGMAEMQIIDFEREIENIICRACAVCISYYIETLDLRVPIHTIELMRQRGFLNFLYGYLKGRKFEHKRVKIATLKRRVIKEKIFKLHGDIIKIVLRVQRVRDCLNLAAKESLHSSQRRV